MRFSHPKHGEITVHSTYMDNVHLRKGGTLSLYWVRNEVGFFALSVQRLKGRVFMLNLTKNWEIAKREFLAYIVRHGKRTNPRQVHTLSIYLGLDYPRSDMHRCVAICKDGRKVVDVIHSEKIGSLGLAFREMKKECGCRHRKKYEELDQHWFSTSYTRGCDVMQSTSI